MDLNSAMQQYFIATGRQLEPLPPKPVLSDFYMPSEDHHNRELVFITLSVIGIGALLWYSDKQINISYNYMSIYTGNDLDNRLKALEIENELLRKYNDYHQVVHEIDHMSDLHLDYSPPQRFLISLKRRNGRVQCVSIIARVAADGPGPLKPDRKRKGNLCQNDYVLTYTLCVLTYISQNLCYHWSG